MKLAIRILSVLSIIAFAIFGFICLCVVLNPEIFSAAFEEAVAEMNPEEQEMMAGLVNEVFDVFKSMTITCFLGLVFNIVVLIRIGSIKSKVESTIYGVIALFLSGLILAILLFIFNPNDNVKKDRYLGREDI